MKTSDKNKLPDLLTFAENLAREAGLVTLKYFRKNISVELKKDKSPVTRADRETESFIRTAVREKFPDHSIIGEEHGEEITGNRMEWIIDPIDGTRSFIHGVPLYTVLIALLIDRVPVLGVIHNPPLDETISAAVGLGCRYNGSHCSVSNTDKLSDAYVQVTDFADLAQGYPDFSSRLLQSSGQCRTWGDAYGYLLVATGRSDVMIDPEMCIWDVAPLKPIITEAGGRFTDFKGNNDGLPDTVIATNGQLHDQVLDLV